MGRKGCPMSLGGPEAWLSRSHSRPPCLGGPHSLGPTTPACMHTSSLWAWGPSSHTSQTDAEPELGLLPTSGPHTPRGPLQGQGPGTKDR